MGYPRRQVKRGSGMKRSVAAMLVVAVAVTGCARIRDSRLNPFNWFGKSQPVAEGLMPAEAAAPDGRLLADQILSMQVNRTATGGAIVEASALPPTQGWWNAELVAENGGEPVDGVLTYRFMLAEPAGPRRVSTPQSRELTAAAFISAVKLEGTSRIVVQGLRNSRAAGR